MQYVPSGSSVSCPSRVAPSRPGRVPEAKSGLLTKSVSNSYAQTFTELGTNQCTCYGRSALDQRHQTGRWDLENAQWAPAVTAPFSLSRLSRLYRRSVPRRRHPAVTDLLSAEINKRKCQSCMGKQSSLDLGNAIRTFGVQCFLSITCRAIASRSRSGSEIWIVNEKCQ